MYYEYWNLQKPPFDNVPDPTMYAACHTSMENAVAETQFAIEEGGDCVTVIVGDVGLGKTMSIRIIIDSLNSEKYKMALITNPSTTFVQLLREVVGQITGKPCEERRKDDLLEIFNRLLFETCDEGKRILIFIDEANVLSAKKLEELRLLTNMQEDNRNLFTMILVGQMELAKRLEHSKKANFFQRIGTYCRIEKIPAEEQLKNYVETRLQRAGGSEKIFTEDSFHEMWECSEHGVPRLINKICKLSLKAGETNELTEINGEIIRQIGNRFQKMTRPAAPERKPRKRYENETAPVPVKESQDNSKMNPEDHGEELIEPVTAKDVLLKPILCLQNNGDNTPLPVEGDSGDEEVSVSTNRTISVHNGSEQKTEEVIHDSTVRTGMFSKENSNTDVHTYLEDVAVKKAKPEEIDIGGNRFQLDLSSSLMQQAITSDQVQRYKLAGTIAAQALKTNKELTKAASADPIPIWNEIKNFILFKIERPSERQSKRD